MGRKKKVSKPVFCGRRNIAGLNIRQLRLSQTKKMSQNALAVQMQLLGVPTHKNRVQQIENGTCGVLDIELVAIARILNVSVSRLVDPEIYKTITFDNDQNAGLADIAQSSDTYGLIDYKEPEDN